MATILLADFGTRMEKGFVIAPENIKSSIEMDLNNGASQVFVYYRHVLYLCCRQKGDALGYRTVKLDKRDYKYILDKMVVVPDNYY